MSTVMTIALYQAKEGKEAALMAALKRHRVVLREEGLTTTRPHLYLKAPDQTVLEIFEWASQKAVETGHENARLQEVWGAYEEACAFKTLGDLGHANKMFPDFVPFDLDA